MRPKGVWKHWAMLWKIRSWLFRVLRLCGSQWLGCWSGKPRRVCWWLLDPRGAHFLYLCLKKVLGNCNCSIPESLPSLESLEHILPSPCRKPCALGVCHGEFMEFVLLRGSRIARRSYLLFLYVKHIPGRRKGQSRELNTIFHNPGERSVLERDHC